MAGKRRVGGKKVYGGFWAILRRLCMRRKGIDRSDKQGEFLWMIEISR